MKLKRPDPAAVRRFREILNDGNIVNTCRYTKGDDIAAACGQLALQEAEPKAESSCCTNEFETKEIKLLNVI